MEMIIYLQLMSDKLARQLTTHKVVHSVAARASSNPPLLSQSTPVTMQGIRQGVRNPSLPTAEELLCTNNERCTYIRPQIGRKRDPSADVGPSSIQPYMRIARTVQISLPITHDSQSCLISQIYWYLYGAW